ncbi:RCC1 domain-containing protein [Rhizobium sp.]
MTVQVSAGNHYSLFFKDGVAYSVGENNESQLGRGEVTDVGVAWADVGAVNVPDGFTGEIVAISAGMLHGAFLTATGEVYTWGDNNLGKLGQGTTTNYESLVPTKVAALDGVEIASIYMANGASYAISADGVLYSWGQNTNGQLGIGSLTNTGTPTAVSSAAFGGEKVASMAWGTSYALVLTESGEVYAMGGNVQGQLGQGNSGSATRSNVPVLVDIPGTVVKVMAGTNTSLAVTSDGKVWGWGQSDYGQLIKGEIVDGVLTNADSTNTLVPTEIQGLPDNVIDAHIGSRWAIALTADGEVWAWGRNDEGWLGLETSTGAIDTLIAPTKIPGFDGINIVSIAGGPNHSLAIDDEGNIYGWGNMNQGRLGTEQEAGTWASGPILIPLEDDGREVIIGTAEADADLNGGDLPDGTTGFSIYGYGGNDTINGSVGDDYLNGGVGDDSLFGGDGADMLVGASGNDFLDGGLGADTLLGGDGDDIYVVDDAGDLVIEELDHGHDTVRASITYTLGANVEDLVLTGGDNIDGTGNGLANSLTGNDGNNRLDGGVGADTMAGGLGDDTYVVDDIGDIVIEAADAGIDLVKASISYTLTANVENLSLTGTSDIDGYGNELANVLRGNRGDNRLFGHDGADQLFGGAGADRLVGGLGADRLTGGAGADLFVFNAVEETLQRPSGRDIITDFKVKQGDRIDLRSIDANTNTRGDDAFHLIGGDRFSGTAGELRLVDKGRDLIVRGDVDGDGKADFSIYLENVDWLDKGSFLL